MNDWQSTLRQFINANPDLPEGNDPQTAEETAGKSKPARLDIILDRKGRAGKTATIITGFPQETCDKDISSLAGRLKQRLGTGGSSRGGEILIQGDRRKEVAAMLEKEGYKTRLL